MTTSSTSRALLLTALLLGPHAGAARSAQDTRSVFEGRWLAYKPKPGRIELDRFFLDLRVTGEELRGSLVLPEIEVPVTGLVDARAGSASFSASADGRTATFELRAAGDGLVGMLDQWGPPVEVRAERATHEREARAPYSERS